MNDMELQTFNEQLSGAFPCWKPTQYENNMWAAKLRKLELWQAQDALGRYFENMSMTESKGNPTMSKFLGYLPKNKTVGDKLDNKCGITLIRRNKGENSYWVQPIHFKAGITPDQIYENGLKIQQRYTERYGGKWYLFCELLRPVEAKQRLFEIESGERPEFAEMPIDTPRESEPDGYYGEDMPW